MNSQNQNVWLSQKNMIKKWNKIFFVTFKRNVKINYHEFRPTTSICPFTYIWRNKCVILSVNTFTTPTVYVGIISVDTFAIIQNWLDKIEATWHVQKMGLVISALLAKYVRLNQLFYDQIALHWWIDGRTYTRLSKEISKNKRIHSIDTRMNS